MQPAASHVTSSLRRRLLSSRRAPIPLCLPAASRAVSHAPTSSGAVREREPWGSPPTCSTPSSCSPSAPPPATPAPCPLSHPSSFLSRPPTLQQQVRGLSSTRPLRFTDGVLRRGRIGGNFGSSVSNFEFIVAFLSSY